MSVHGPHDGSRFYRDKLDALRNAALSDDWKAAADAYLEIALEAKGKPESAQVDALGSLPRLRDGDRMAVAVDELARGS